MNHVISIKHDSGEESRFTFVPPKATAQHDRDYVYAEGRSCTVYLAKDSDENLHLVKKFKKDFQPQKLLKDRDISNHIKNIHEADRRVYIPHQEYMGTDEEGNRYQIFKFLVQSRLEELIPLSTVRITSRETLCERIRSLLNTFRGLLSHVELIHSQAKYLHCDITLSNVVIFRPNDQPIIQLIDWDSALKVTDLLTLNTEQIEDYMMDRSSPVMRMGGEDYDIYTMADIEKYARLDFQQNKSLAFVLDTTGLAKILRFLLFGNTTSLQNSLTLSYQEAFPQSFMLLQDFFSKAFSESLENRFTSCDQMLKKIDEVIKGLPRWINYNNAHAELLTKHSGLQAVETRLGEINFDILPHIQLGETVYVQQGTRSPLEQLMEHPHDKALFLYGEGGAGKSTTAKHFFYSTLRERPENRLVLYFPLTQEGISDIRRYLEHPLSAELCSDERVANKPIVLFDALDESAIVASNNSDVYGAFYELVKKYGDRYFFVVTSRNIPEEPKEKDHVHVPQKGVAFSDVFQAGRFLELDDDQLKNFLQHEGLRLEEIEQQNGEELVETLRLPMMLKLFVQIIENASKEEKEEAFKLTNEVKLIRLYFQKLFKEDQNSPYYDENYKKGEEFNELYENEDYTSEKFEQECAAIAEAVFFCKQVKLHPRTKRIFNSIIIPVGEEGSARIKKYAEKLYRNSFASHPIETQQKILKDLHNARITFDNYSQKNIFEAIKKREHRSEENLLKIYRKILEHLDNCIKETEEKDREKADQGNSCPISNENSYDILSKIKSSIGNFAKPGKKSKNLLETVAFAHKIYRDYFKSWALACQFEKLFASLKRNADSENYQKADAFFHKVNGYSIMSRKEWRLTGLHLGLDREDTPARNRARQFKYLYECYFGYFDRSTNQFKMMNDIYDMLSMTYKCIQDDPFEPSVQTSTNGSKQFGFSNQVTNGRTSFTIEKTHGCRYAAIYQIPKGVTSISRFDYCPNLKKIILGEDVTWISSDAFVNCPALEEIDTCQNKNFISKEKIVFHIKSGYPVWPQTLPDEIIIPGEIQTINIDALSMFIFTGKYGQSSPYKNAQKLIFSEGVQIISCNIFKNCNQLVYAAFPATIKDVSISVNFEDCPNLKYLKISNSFLECLKPAMVHYSRIDQTYKFAPSVTTLHYTGTSIDWGTARKPSEFFTKFFPNLKEILCLGDGITLTGEDMKT